MKVRLSYAVELDEVPQKAQEMIKRIEYDMSLRRDILSKAGLIVTDEKCVSSVAELLDDVRKDMADLDQSLADVHSILSGYVDVKAQLAAQEQQSVPPAMPEPTPPEQNSTPPMEKDDDIREG